MRAPKTNFERSQVQMNCKHVDWISHKSPVFWKFRQKQLGKGRGSWILQNWRWCWEFLSLPGRPTRSICQLFVKTGQHLHLIFLALKWLSWITQGSVSVLPSGAYECLMSRMPAWESPEAEGTQSCETARWLPSHLSISQSPRLQARFCEDF